LSAIARDSSRRDVVSKYIGQDGILRVSAWWPANGDDENAGSSGRWAYPPIMDKKEINSPKLTTHFVIWMCVGCLLLLAFLAHYLWKVF
jgi:hypothetical protein